jgi:defect-in-organelle-trafficking protein DotC
MAMDMPPMTLEEAQRLYDRPAYVQSVERQDAATLTEAMKAQKNEAAKARSQAILDTALGVGVKAGMAWQLRNIEEAIKRHQRDLDTIYDFGRLMIQDRVVPPVIIEARDLYNQDGDYTLRLSGAYYKIEYQARFSSVAPNWREYLTFPKPDLDRSALMAALLPRNSEEKKVWELAVADGWKQGVEQANLMLQYGLDRMNRDYIGMLRFHSFVMQGKLTMPAIASESIAVTHNGQTMAIDETLLRITTLPEFNGKMANWTSAIKSSSDASPTAQIAAPPPPPPKTDPKNSAVAHPYSASSSVPEAKPLPEKKER